MAFNGLIDGAKNFLNKAKDLTKEKLGIPKKPDIVIKPDDDFLQAMGKVLNSVKIQFKELGKRISESSVAKDVKKEWAKGLHGKMFACICAILASPVICVGLFIESLVELNRAACNFYNANMKALEQGQQK